MTMLNNINDKATFQDLEKVNNDPQFLFVLKCLKAEKFDTILGAITTNFENEKQLFLDLLTVIEHVREKYSSGLLLNRASKLTEKEAEEECFNLILKMLSREEIYTLIEEENIKQQVFNILTKTLIFPKEESMHRFSKLMETSPILFNKSLLLVKEIKRQEGTDRVFNEKHNEAFEIASKTNKVLMYANTLC